MYTVKLQEEKEKLRGKQVAGNPAALKKQIDDLEYQIETQGLSFPKEQKLMLQIKEKKKLLKQLGGITEVHQKVKSIDKELKTLREKAATAHAGIQEKAAASQKKHESLVESAKALRTLQKERKKINADCTKHKEEHAAKFVELKKIQDILGVKEGERYA